MDLRKNEYRLPKIFYSTILDAKILVFVFLFLYKCVHAHGYYTYLVRV